MDLHLRPEILAAGITDGELRRALRDGRLAAVRPGAYVIGALPGDELERHRLLVTGELEHLSDAAVVSHASAAVLHGLPLWGIPLESVHVTRDRRRSGARRGNRVHSHSAPLDADETVAVDGMVVTSVARTVVDIARTTPFEQAVVVADAALRLGVVDAPALGHAALRWPGWPGMPSARRAVAFADGRSESVGESRSRVAILREGLPAPVLQWEVRAAADGRLIGRVDFGWREGRTIGEFDGRAKYGRLLGPDQDPAEMVYREKLREDRLRAEGLAVVRWTWADLAEFAPVAARLRGRLQPS